MRFTFLIQAVIFLALDMMSECTLDNLIIYFFNNLLVEMYFL